MDYFSQFGEDRILAEIFSDKPTGFCIEVGANDGVNDSTTLYFEKRGWDCLLIEPNPVLCERIREVRSSPLVQCAASDKNGEITLFVAEGAPRAHGVSSVHGGGAAQEKIKSYGFSSKEVKVLSRRLDDILQELKIERPIDFISIDVEGHELAVLKGFSVGHWRPSILLLEDNENYRDPAVRHHLKSLGYLPFRRTGVNDWYAHSENRQLVNWRSRCSYWHVRVSYFRKNLTEQLKMGVKEAPWVMPLWRVWKKLRDYLK